jgi:ubiquinone/menaquinone biosynthesis C-methylase UbiE
MRSYDFLTQVDGYARNIEDIVEAAVARPGTRVLDAGSGTGNLSLVLKRAGCNVTSCDFSPNALAAHKAKDPEARLIQASLEDPLPFQDSQFDVVCCASVLFALTRQGCELAVSEFRRVLRSAGRVVVTVPSSDQRNGNLVGMHYRGLVRKHGWAYGSLRGLWSVPALLSILHYNRQLGKLPDWQGFHRFNEEELRELLASVGFGQVHIGRTYGGNFLLATAQKPAVATHRTARTVAAAATSQQQAARVAS